MILSPQEKTELFESVVDDVILYSSKVDDLDHVLKSSTREIVRALLEGKETVTINLRNFASLELLQRDLKEFFQECAGTFFEEKISEVIDEMYPNKELF